MRTGARISAVGHGALIGLALFGLPWFGPPERDPIQVTEVSFISEAEFAAAQAAAPAEVPHDDAAPAVLPAPRPAEAQPEPAEPTPPPDEVAALEPPSEPEAQPETGRITPRVVTVAPPTVSAPPRARPAPRVEPDPTPPDEALRPAETPKPVIAPAKEAEVARLEEPPAALPEAAPEPVAEPEPTVPLALETSARPKPRQAKPAPPKPVAKETPKPQVTDAAAAVMAALQKEQRKAKPTPPTPATPPSETEATATSLPSGPPLSNAEKDGLRLAVQKCWNVPAGLRDAQELKVVLAAELSADGSVINASIRMIEPSPAPDSRFQQAYEAGRRALIRCSPYGELPRDKYAEWRNIEVVFNPEGMVSW